MTVLGALLTGDILMRILFKSDRRIADAKADSAEAQADTDEWHRYKEELDRYSGIIKSLQDMLQAQIDRNETLMKDHAAERAELETRFNNQTDRLRDTQRLMIAASDREVEYVKRIGVLELELEKKRCDDLPCPFRQPPNAHTPPKQELTKEMYFNEKENATS